MPVDPEWIDIDTLKTWLSTCDTEHRPQCFDTISQISGGARWLIDVVKGSLVPAKAGNQYAALSYVWGQTETVRTIKDNLVYLLEKGSIFAHEHLLPKTIRDTIRLVKLLGINYLWVDCLCIVQDDAELKHAQIQEMGAVFARAYVTIIAANGWDANHGLRGIRNVTGPRHLSRYSEDIFYESLQPHLSIWNSRGWTFQEMIFSRRKIVFHYQVAVWECQCSIWDEATMDNKATRDNVVPSILTLTGTDYRMKSWRWTVTFGLWPDVLQYIDMVHEYNNRQLTFPADGLQAIAGLLAVMNRSFHGGFICGLPQMFFDDALLWQPCNSLQRRIPKTRGNDRNVLPSWSWAGWQGEIESGQWASHWDYLSLAFHKNAVIWKLESTVEWSYGESRENRQAVEVSSHRYRRCFTDKSIPLPPGWSRKPAATDAIHDGKSATPNENNSLAMDDHFVHVGFPGIKFGYPIPLPKRDQQNRFPTMPQYLFGRTRRGYFKEYRKPFVYSQWPQKNFVTGPYTSISLLDNYGKWAGMIQLHDSALVAPVTKLLLDDSSELELVSISAGTATSESRLYDCEYMTFCRDGMKNADVYEFYNVLWIEWNEGVAYRKGLGRVIKEAWERQATEWIDLTLG